MLGPTSALMQTINTLGPNAGDGVLDETSSPLNWKDIMQRRYLRRVGETERTEIWGTHISIAVSRFPFQNPEVVS